MAKFNTSSGFSDLDGECDITGVDITQYISTALGNATKIENKGSGSDLHAKVTFAGVTKPFTIKAKKNASGDFNGGADDDNVKTEETWAATATGEPVAMGKGY